MPICTGRKLQDVVAEGDGGGREVDVSVHDFAVFGFGDQDGKDGCFGVHCWIVCLMCGQSELVLLCVLWAEW